MNYVRLIKLCSKISSKCYKNDKKAKNWWFRNIYFI